MYNLPDKLRSTELFGATTLELVKLVQAGLSIFGKFDLSPEERNGLLCDVTVNGIQRWIAEIGEPCLGVEVRGFSSVGSCLCSFLSVPAHLLPLVVAMLARDSSPREPLCSPMHSFQHC